MKKSYKKNRNIRTKKTKRNKRIKRITKKRINRKSYKKQNTRKTNKKGGGKRENYKKQRAGSGCFTGYRQRRREAREREEEIARNRSAEFQNRMAEIDRQNRLAALAEEEAERENVKPVAHDILLSLEQSDNPDEECSICFETADDGAAADPENDYRGWRKLECGHSFHANCIYGWMRYQLASSIQHNVPTCPICREEIKGPARP